MFKLDSFKEFLCILRNERNDFHLLEIMRKNKVQSFDKEVVKKTEHKSIVLSFNLKTTMKNNVCINEWAF